MRQIFYNWDGQALEHRRLRCELFALSLVAYRPDDVLLWLPLARMFPRLKRFRIFNNAAGRSCQRRIARDILLHRNWQPLRTMALLLGASGWVSSGWDALMWLEKRFPNKTQGTAE